MQEDGYREEAVKSIHARSARFIQRQKRNAQKALCIERCFLVTSYLYYNTHPSCGKAARLNDKVGQATKLEVS